MSEIDADREYLEETFFDEDCHHCGGDVIHHAVERVGSFRKPICLYPGDPKTGARHPIVAAWRAEHRQTP